MALVGYARVSSKGQNLERQLQELNEANVDKLFTEKESGASLENRPALQAVLDYLREGDTLVISSLDRLSRNYDDLKETVQYLMKNNIGLQVLDAEYLKLDANDPLSKAMFDMMLTMLSFVADNEREKIRERQRQGIDIAKKNGIYKGRPTLYRADSPDPSKSRTYHNIVSDLKEGRAVSSIAKENKVSRPTVYKIKEQAGLSTV